MKRISEEKAHFLLNQGCVIVSTIDKDGFSHSACKGIIKINQSGKIYLLDLYRTHTFHNLERNPNISITAVDEHKFKGYCFKGKAEKITKSLIHPNIIKAWEDRITSRLTQRLLKNIREEKGDKSHPEVLLPKPEYIIVMAVEKIVDLTPRNLKLEK